MKCELCDASFDKGRIVEGEFRCVTCALYAASLAELLVLFHLDCTAHKGVLHVRDSERRLVAFGDCRQLTEILCNRPLPFRVTA